jgi:hypothetical protein
MEMLKSKLFRTMPDLAATSHGGLWRLKHPLLIATWFFAFPLEFWNFLELIKKNKIEIQKMKKK